MCADVSTRILTKLNETAMETDVRDFLALMLGFELEHVGDMMPHYKQEYDRAIAGVIGKVPPEGP
jgi:hypothetical protein